MGLESGPARADRNWHILRAVLFLGFAAWFVMDGAIRWPAKNRAEAEKLLQVAPFNGRVRFDELPERPDKEDFDRLVKSSPNKPEQVHAAFGQPTLTDGTDQYFLSRYGYAKVPVKGGLVRPQDMVWRNWAKTRAEIRAQFYWAIVPIIPGLYFLWRLYKAATLRVVIDEQGMTYDKLRIPFEKMVALRDYNPKGWIDLYYESDRGQKKLRLDNEKVKLFDEIVAAICAAKGFVNEVQEYRQRQASEE